MAEVAVPDPFASNTFPFGKGAAKVQADATMKRKTPSELRAEQLKWKNIRRPDESFDNLPVSDVMHLGKVRGLRKLEPSKTPKYIDTRVDEVFPIKKCSDIFRNLDGKEKVKGSFPSSEQTGSTKSASTTCNVAANSKCQMSCEKDGVRSNSDSSTASAKDDSMQSSQKIEKCSQKTFRGAAELSTGSKMQSDSTFMDMDKALKGFVARELPIVSGQFSDFSRRASDLPAISAGSFSFEVNIPGHKAPIDLTLKTNMRLISSLSVSWCHRLTTSSGFTAVPHFSSYFGGSLDQSVRKLKELTPAEVLFSNALHSWAYPQSSIPTSIISSMTLSAARGETDFLLKRQQAWEDSFRSLYYLLRKSMCDIFYLYTSQFVVMFIGGDFSGNLKRSCNAYLSQSTRGLRSLLTENNICFSMPLCDSEVEQATAEDLVELSEIEKCHLGQAHRLDCMSNVDNSSKSLLAFIGNEAVHGLYDFLFNYRSFMSSLTVTDVPVLYSPVPFQNASLCAPEVRCKEVKRDSAALRSTTETSFQDSLAICYSLVINDAILPPWTVFGVCAAMGFEERSFEASFETDPVSSGLNVALDAIPQKSDPLTNSSNGLPETSNGFSIVGAVVAKGLQSASLRSLKYSNGSYLATLLPA